MGMAVLKLKEIRCINTGIGKQLRMEFMFNGKKMHGIHLDTVDRVLLMQKMAERHAISIPLSVSIVERDEKYNDPAILTTTLDLDFRLDGTQKINASLKVDGIGGDHGRYAVFDFVFEYGFHEKLIDIWVDAFIPFPDIFNPVMVPPGGLPMPLVPALKLLLPYGWTRNPVPGGSGLTIVKEFWYHKFKGDDRSFKKFGDARVAVYMLIDVSDEQNPKVISKEPRVGTTYGFRNLVYQKIDGTYVETVIIDEARASLKDIEVSADNSGTGLHAHFKCHSQIPLLPQWTEELQNLLRDYGSPLLDFAIPGVSFGKALDDLGHIDFDIRVSLRRDGENVKYVIDGAHDGFPAYSVYIGSKLAYNYSPPDANPFLLGGELDCKIEESGSAPLLKPK